MSTRTLEIQLLNELVAIDFETLEEDYTEYVDLLTEANSNAHLWTRLACEYWKHNNLDAAKDICESAIKGVCARLLRLTL